MPAASDLEGMLREASLYVTRPRMAVLAAVDAHPHADTNSIIELVRAAKKNDSSSERSRRSTSGRSTFTAIGLRPSGVSISAL